MVLSSGSQGLTLLSETIAGGSGPSRTAAIQLVHEIDLPGAVNAIGQLLPKVTAPIQVALIGALAQSAQSPGRGAVRGLRPYVDPRRSGAAGPPRAWKR